MECVIEILKESSVFLCRDLPMHMFITLLLIFPVSSLTLSQVLMNRDVARKIEEAAASWLTPEYHHITNNSYNNNTTTTTRVTSEMKKEGGGIGSLEQAWWGMERLVCGQVSEALAAQLMALPVALTLGMLAKVGAWHVMRARWEGRRARLDEALSEGPPAWARLVATHLAGLGLVSGLAVSAVAVRGAVSVSAGAGAVLVMDAALAALLVILLPHALTVLHVSVSVAGLHGSRARSGPSAILAALALLKRRRIQPGLLLFLLSCSASAAIEFIFQVRILGRRSHGYGYAGDPDTPSLHRLLEAPILVFAHAFVSLLDTIASFCFFNACTEASVQEYMALISTTNHHHRISSHSAAAAAAPSQHHAFHIPDLDLIHQHHGHGHHHHLSHDDHIEPLQCDEAISSDQLYQQITHHDDNDDDDHFSAAVNMLEKHCRKLFNLYISSSTISSSSSSSSNFA